MPGLFPFFQREERDTPIGYSSITGNEIYSSLVFLPTKIPIDEVEPGQSDTLRDDRRPDGEFHLETVLMSVSRTKNVIETEVQNRADNVFEYISAGNYNIRVAGSLVSKERTVSPIEDKILLDRFLSLGKSLKIAGDFLGDLDILTVVVMDYDIAELPGTRNQIDFRITMKSDTPVELEIKEALDIDLEQNQGSGTQV